MKNKRPISKDEISFFLNFLVDHGCLSSYLKLSAEYAPDFYMIFSEENESVPIDKFISSAFPWLAANDPKEWLHLHKQWIQFLEYYRSTKK